MKGKGGRYFNKVPPFTPDPEHFTRKKRLWKAKVSYESEDEAWEWLNQRARLKAMGYTAYQCGFCSKWHIGRMRDGDNK